MKKNIIIVICVILVIILLGIMLFNKRKEIDDTRTHETESAHLDIYDTSKSKEVKETTENTAIQGIVELNHNGYIYIFNGQHFGEYGFEMEEYTMANIIDKKQECIDYYTAEKYDTSYIQEGDIIICIGDLTKYTNEFAIADFDTKDNPIIVLKSSNYYTMKKEKVISEPQNVGTIGAYYSSAKEVYIKYELSDKGYNLPFAFKFYITPDTQIIGNLQKGKNVVLQYKNLNVPLDELELKSIEVIDELER